MSVNAWILIGLIILDLLIVALLEFLAAIDIIDDDNVGCIFICIAIPPIGLILLIAYGFILFYDLCEKHKDKIRKFLGIK